MSPGSGMSDRSQENIERQVNVNALRKAAQDYEELMGELSVLKLLNDSLQAGLGFSDICSKLVQFVTETMNVENASVMVMDHERGELRLLTAKNSFEEEGAVFEDHVWSGKVFKLGEGIPGQVAKSRKSILINDTKSDPWFVKTGGQVSAQSLLSLPLIHGERLHGVLNLSNSHTGAFDSRKEHALNIIASTASVALSHALALEDLRDMNEELAVRNKELCAVIALSESLHANLDLDAVLAESLNNILDAFDIDSAAVFLKDEKEDAMELRSFNSRMAHPDPKALFRVLSLRFGREIVKSKKPVLYQGTFGEQDGKPTGRPEPTWCVGVPLFSGKDCFGMLMMFGPREREPQESEIKLLASFCNQISLAIRNSTLVSCLKEKIRELQETRRKLVQSDKLALLGEMLSGVAHEINNPLAAIMGYSELLLGEKSLSERHHEMLRKIVLCVDRSRKIVHGLLSFARKTELKKESVTINSIIDKVLEHRDYDFAFNNIEIVKDYEPNEPVVVVDLNQIEQVFLNLINNAFDAMVGRDVRGRLEIRTRSLQNSVMQIEFTDNGRGIRDSDRPKVFEPFFTTKEVGKGTGLGLSISYGIIKEHGGNLYLDEHYVDGTKFVITLPIVCAQPAGEGLSTQGNPPESTKARGRILVVDDEEVVTDIVRVSLSSDGFVVECASDGEMAWKMLGSNDYDLIITDIRMPGLLDGCRLYSKIREEKPALAKRVVFITGDIMEKQTAQFLKESERSFLLKPFSIKDLRQVVSKNLHLATSPPSHQ